MDIRLHKAGDPAVIAGTAVVDEIDLSNGDIVLLDGIEAIRQHILIRLRFFLGEWMLDTRVGIPYYQEILIKNPSTNVVESILRQAIVTTPGVLSLREFGTDFDSPNRRLTVTFVASVTGSTEPLVFDEELIINV